MWSRSSRAIAAAILSLFTINLSHTFPLLPRATTTNLTDYPPAGGQDGSRLIKPQWDLVHNPKLTTGLLDDEGDGASIFGGTEETDMFDSVTGKFLGTIKNAKTAEIRIIKESDWDACGKSNNYIPCQGVNIGDNKIAPVIIAIFNHYYSIVIVNNHQYKLNELENSTVKSAIDEIWFPADIDYIAETKKFRLRVAYNYMGTTLMNKYDVMNLFVHEREGHGSDFLAHKKRDTETEKDEWERQATLLMMKDKTWAKTSKVWKQYMFDIYGWDNHIIKENERKIYFYPYGVTGTTPAYTPKLK